MRFYKVIEERPLDDSAAVGIQPRTVAGKLDAALVIDELEPFAKLDMVFNRKIELGLFPEYFNYLVILFAARDDVGIGHVRQTQQLVAKLLLYGFELFVIGGYLVAELAHPREYRLDVLARLFQPGHVRADLVLLRL